MKLDSPTSYLSPKLIIVNKPDLNGKGVIATKSVEKDELIAVWSGVIMNSAQLLEIPDENRQHSVQVEDGFFLVSINVDEPPDYINHSCDANVGMRGQICLIAMRKILPGEEVTIDYAMVDTIPYDEFRCACGSEKCRGAFTADDWMLPEIRERYRGYFAPHVQRKIDKITLHENNIQ
ncbi:MAG: SET domain-containing protein [Anaerolineaceae bacterium]|nr:SET domain-containing protein [Anaerolineaceae bacterium]